MVMIGLEKILIFCFLCKLVKLIPSVITLKEIVINIELCV